MLASINPLGERGRNQRYRVTVTAYIVGSTVAGAGSGRAARSRRRARVDAARARHRRRRRDRGPCARRARVRAAGARAPDGRSTRTGSSPTAAGSTAPASACSSASRSSRSSPRRPRGSRSRARCWPAARSPARSSARRSVSRAARSSPRRGCAIRRRCTRSCAGSSGCGRASRVATTAAQGVAAAGLSLASVGRYEPSGMRQLAAYGVAVGVRTGWECRILRRARPAPSRRTRSCISPTSRCPSSATTSAVVSPRPCARPTCSSCCSSTGPSRSASRCSRRRACPGSLRHVRPPAFATAAAGTGRLPAVLHRQQPAVLPLRRRRPFGIARVDGAGEPRAQGLEIQRMSDRSPAPSGARASPTASSPASRSASASAARAAAS